METKYSLNGWANLCQDGFTMTHTCGHINWLEKVTANNKIIIHLESHFDNCTYEYESDNGFTLRKIYGLMNDSYFKYCDEYLDGDYDYISENGSRRI